MSAFEQQANNGRTGPDRDMVLGFAREHGDREASLKFDVAEGTIRRWRHEAKKREREAREAAPDTEEQQMAVLRRIARMDTITDKALDRLDAIIGKTNSPQVGAVAMGIISDKRRLLAIEQREAEPTPRASTGSRVNSSARCSQSSSTVCSHAPEMAPCLTPHYGHSPPTCSGAPHATRGSWPRVPDSWMRRGRSSVITTEDGLPSHCRRPGEPRRSRKLRWWRKAWLRRALRARRFPSASIGSSTRPR